ncbi:hypothetical protein AMELA_G00051320 [Ameiurus melas]|uniref:Uncharacterized protein n=1 Tax=Ameiurus melas TaxID=219545 RepID=A0A7J6B7I0_AMEME|nr:hypothetical protein AMELA_G00051320 [Ameiurus melas]
MEVQSRCACLLLERVYTVQERRRALGGWTHTDNSRRLPSGSTAPNRLSRSRAPRPFGVSRERCCVCGESVHELPARCSRCSRCCSSAEPPCAMQSESMHGGDLFPARLLSRRAWRHDLILIVWRSLADKCERIPSESRACMIYSISCPSDVL